ncbi:MAG: hypothetical protein ACE5EH_12985 [Gammaproteobacteria bacterium]
MTVNPEMVAYISFIVQSVKRFIPKAHMEWAVPCVAILTGLALGYKESGLMGFEAGILAALTALAAYEGVKQVGKKVVGDK